MRVISGTSRGTKLKSLEGDSTRPTLDRVKEALFNIISGYVYDSVVLDLFSGSGALAVEALSRGATKAIVCDNNKKAIQIINDNLDKTRLIQKAIVINDDYINCLNFLKNKDMKFNLIFLDPPYSKELGIKAIQEISNLDLLNQDGIIILETDKTENVPTTIGIYKKSNERIYGRVKINFFEQGN